jgi:hypothetical protein
VIQSVPVGGATSGAFLEATNPTNYTISTKSTALYSSLNIDYSTPTNSEMHRELLSQVCFTVSAF